MGGATAFSAAYGLDVKSFAQTADNPFKAADYQAMCEELRAFYPAGFCRGKCQSKAVLASFRAILSGLDAWAKDNPGYDALDARCAYYRLVQKHFQPVLFKESPFYFEAGVNGGWSGANGGGNEANPAFRVKQLCAHLGRGVGRIPESAFRLMEGRNEENLLLCCGTFVDEMHNIPPFRTILKKGFGGIRAEVADALSKCPANDPAGRKQLESAILGLDTIHDVQLSFAKAANEKLKAVGEGEERRNLLQPNCNSVEELLDAQRHPERHRNIMVRVCGFSARFVNLSKRWQDEIIARNRLR